MLDLKQKTPYHHLSYDELFSHCQSCQNCDLSSTRTNVVVGSGTVPCNLMIIGEGPGEQEDLKGLPFIGKSGQLLSKMLEEVGINREKEVYIANTVKCRPPKNRTPLPTEINTCKAYLIRQIQLIQPKIILLLGAPSLKTILEEKRTITNVRGQWFTSEVDYMDPPVKIMPIFHPSYLLRNQRNEKGTPKWLTGQDLKEVKVTLDFYRI